MHEKEDSLLNSVVSENVVDLASAAADVGIDALISSGALDGVPLVALLTSTYKAGRDIRNRLFVRKVARFLGPISNISKSDRENFLKSLRDDGKMKEFGDAIILLLERSDDMSKPAIIGRVWAAHMKGYIDRISAMRLSRIINRCYTEDLQFLPDMAGTIPEQLHDVANSLFSAGLLKQGIVGGAFFDDPGTPGGSNYTLNKYGEMLLQHCL